MSTRFTPGDWVAICGEGAWILAQLSFEDERLNRLWDTLSSEPTDASAGGSLDAALEVLLADGFAAMPAFAAAASGADGATRIVVRHPAVIDVLVDGAPVRHAATPGGTWTDVTLPASGSLVLRAGAEAPSTIQLPLRHGMTPAAAITVALAAAAPAPVAEPAAAPAAEAAEAEVAEPEVEAAPAAEAAATEPDEPTSAPAEEPAPAASTEVEVADDSPAEPGLLTSETVDRDVFLARIAEQSPDLVDTAPESSPAPEASAPEGDEPNSHTASPFTAVWNAGEAPPAPPPAAPAAENAKSSALIDGVPWLRAGSWTPEPAAPRNPSPPTPPAPPRPSATAAPATPPAGSPLSTGKIGGSFSPAPASPAAASSPSAPTGSTDLAESETKTVTRADLLKDLGSAGLVGPTVLAAYCPAGHQTSSHEPRCRQCGVPVPEQEPVQVARPALGALVLANGDRLVLDKDAVVGRAPYEPEGSTDRPHLLKVGDSGEVSRQHALVTLDGWHVLVRDLGTPNGTTLTLPGGTAQQLRANEDYQLEDGAVIGIADVVNLRFEVHP